jgi:hypothetical protein
MECALQLASFCLILRELFAKLPSAALHQDNHHHRTVSFACPRRCCVAGRMVAAATTAFADSGGMSEAFA